MTNGTHLDRLISEFAKEAPRRPDTIEYFRSVLEVLEDEHGVDWGDHSLYQAKLRVLEYVRRYEVT